MRGTAGKRPRSGSFKLFAVLACVVLVANFAVWRAVARLSGGYGGGPPVKVVENRRHEGAQICSEVDVVYTWVNGSDPAHKALLRQYGRNWDAGFRDYGVIRYSIRTVEKFMPWARHIVIVTNGQVPGWANTSSPRLRIVTHDEIFPDRSNLPTFNSNAIEAHLHKIPGLAPCFLYLNDDMFLGRPIPRDLYFDQHGNLKLHMSAGYIAPMYEKMRSNLWHRSVGHSNDLLTRYYYPNATEPVKHHYVSHTCYFMRKDICDTMYARWKSEFDITSSHKFREGTDTAVPFMQANVALEEFGATSERAQNIYGTWSPDKGRNTKFWDRVWDTNNYCVCMNDNLDNSENSMREIDRLAKLFEERFPEPSSCEKHPPKEL